MKYKKMIIIVGVVAIVFLAVFGVSYFVRNRQSSNLLAGEISRNDVGIYYGGDFNEFEYQSDESSEDITESSEAENEDIQKTMESSEEDMEMSSAIVPEDKHEINMENDEEISAELERIRNDFERSKSKNAVNLESAGMLNNANEVSETNQEGGAEEVVQGVGTEAQEKGIVLIKSKGYAEHEVICDAQSREEAENIAGQISGTLITWENNVATIQIEDSVDELLERLEQQGSQLELYRNYYYSLP